MTNFTELTISAEISSFGAIQAFYKNLKISPNIADREVDIVPMLQNEEKEEAIYITLNKEQCKVLAAILNAYSDLL